MKNRIVIICGIIPTILLSACGKQATMMHEVMIYDILPEKLEEYRIAHGHYPPQDEGLNSIFEGKKIVDPWNRPYVYRIPSIDKNKTYDLVCLGQDGVEDEEDIKYTK